MRFPFSWLKKFLDSDASIEEITEKLTSLGHELEEIIDHSAALSVFKVAEILEASKHPEADRLQVCKVNTGSEILQIVCGAPNARSGIKVVLAPVGAIIPNGNFKIKASKIRGVESNGMLCSSEELGLGEDQSGGIIELSSDAKIGDLFINAAGLNDPVIDVSITPNRGDCLGVYGLARELAASGIGSLKPVPILAVKKAGLSPIKVTNQIDKDCPLFTGHYIKNVKNSESPAWLKNLLKAAGLKSISTLVDITNYLCHSFARPLHVYDADKIIGDMTVNYASKGEKFLALDNKEYICQGDEIVIRDEKEIIAMGGVMGGSNSGCSLDTKNVFLESAIFDPIKVAIAGRSHGIISDARFRFERNIDHQFTLNGAEIALSMILELCGGEVSEVVTTGKINNERKEIIFPIAKIKTLGGTEIATNEVVGILEKLGFNIPNQTAENLTIIVPSWRHDINIAEDIVEEVIRLHGYDKVPAAILPKNDNLPGQTINYVQKRRSILRRSLAARGYREVVSWSFLPSKKSKLFAPCQDELYIRNPISSELDYMRPSILPNLLEMASKNAARNFHDLSLFELGPIFAFNQKIEQQSSLSAIRVGYNHKANIYHDHRLFDVFDIKADLAAILAECNIDLNNFDLSKNAASWYHPGRSVSLKQGKNLIGYFGELHPEISNQYEIKHRVVAFELFLDNFLANKSKASKNQPYIVSDYQAVTRDFAFLVPAKLAVSEMSRAIKSLANDKIIEINLFDIYQKNPQDEEKSVAISVLLQASDHTMTENEINEISNEIIKVVSAKTGATLRS